MTPDTRIEPFDLRVARVHAILCGLTFLLLVAIEVFVDGMNGWQRLAVTCTLVYTMLLHGRLAAALRRGEDWARDDSVGLGIMLLMAPPLGSVIGVAMLWTAWGRDRRLPRRKPQVPLIEAWPEADRLRARAAEDRAAPESPG